MMAVMNTTLPVFFVLSVERTLFPLTVQELIMPIKKINDQVVDNNGHIITPYPEVPAVLEMIRNIGIKIAITTECKTLLKLAVKVIRLYEWDKYITFTESYPGFQTTHFHHIEGKTNVPRSQMIYFSNWKFSVENGFKAGVFSVYVDPKDGLTLKVVDDALKEFEKVQKQRELEKVKKQEELEKAKIEQEKESNIESEKTQQEKESENEQEKESEKEQEKEPEKET